MEASTAPASQLQSADLPVRQHEDSILAAVRSSTVTIITGETGSGKTTQLPQMLLDAPGLLDEGHSSIAVTQPRRVAAISVARRVAQERKARVGGEVGYAVRFEESRGGDTRLTYLTDGTLLREMLSDPLLAQYAAVVLDEAHERTLSTDILFSLLKQLVVARSAPDSSLPRLRVIVMSATMDTESISAFFGADNAAVLNVPGRQFPVTEVWSQVEHDKSYVKTAADVAVDIHMHKPPGDILVFLSGQAEVEQAVRLVDQQVQALGEQDCGALLVFGLYAAMPLALQARVFQPVPSGTRRCIVATNIAETSLTLDGVVYVVDSGVCKEKTYDCATGMERLQVQPISRVQAIQRGGRAGRTAPGECFRLYTKRHFDHEMRDVSPPEILRTPLAAAVLHLKSLPAALGIDVLRFDFVDSPPQEALEEALRQLHLLGAIDADGAITEQGSLMVKLPLEPQLGRALLASLELGCAAPMLTAAAMLSVETLFMPERPPALRSPAEEERIKQKQLLLADLQADGVGDHVFMLRVAETVGWPTADDDLVEVLHLSRRGLAFARKVRDQLRGIVESRVWPLLSGHHSTQHGSTQHGGGRHTESAAKNGHSEGQTGERSGRDGERARSPPRERDRERQHGDRSRRGDSGWERDRDGRSGQGKERHRERYEEARGRRDRSRSPGDGARPRRDRDGRSRQDLGGRGRGPEGPGDGGARCPDLRVSEEPASAAQLRRMRRAIAIGYAPQIARRMDRNNGYRTLCAREQTVASLHHDCAKMAIEDGLLPQWVVYHELVSATRTQLRKVCAIEQQWAEPVLEKLRDMETARLATSGAAAGRGGGGNGKSADAEPADANGGGEGGEPRVDATKVDAKRLDDAKARALARRAKGAVGKTKARR